MRTANSSGTRRGCLSRHSDPSCRGLLVWCGLVPGSFYPLRQATSKHDQNNRPSCIRIQVAPTPYSFTLFITLSSGTPFHHGLSHGRIMAFHVAVDVVQLGGARRQSPGEEGTEIAIRHRSPPCRAPSDNQRIPPWKCWWVAVYIYIIEIYFT
jgi:hypothetical protein